MAYHSVGRRCKWPEVHARPSHGTRRSERSAFHSFQIEYLHAYTPNIYEGKHTGKQGPASMHRRLRSVDDHWRRNSCCCRGLSSVVDLKRHAHVIHWRWNPPVDESRAPGSGAVWDAGIRRQPANQAVRLLCSRDGHLRSRCPRERIHHCEQFADVKVQVLCGHYPYREIPMDILAVHAITEGVRPNKPEVAKELGFNDELWNTVELCWLEDRNARPGVGDILSCLNDAAAFWYMREF